MELASHGFLDISMSDTLCNVLPRAQAISRIGIVQEINGRVWEFLDRSLTHNNNYVGWHVGELYKEGSYGKIYKAHRMVLHKESETEGVYSIVEHPTEVIIKRVEPPTGSLVLPAQDITAHTSESLLHVLAWNVIQDTQTPWGIPRPFEVFGTHDPAAPGWLSMSLCMSYVHGRTLQSFIEKNWHRRTPRENTEDFLEIIAQTAYILYYLQTVLRLNHRDLKINNVLVRRRDPSDTLVLVFDDLPILCRYEVVLIDFGFACVGCPPPEPPNTVFQAGSWFPSGELCCKAGRDLAQLIYSIHCYFPLERYLTAPVAKAVREWMRIPWTGGIADALTGFTKEGRPRHGSARGHAEYNTGIYEFLRRPEVDPESCDPRHIYHEIYRLKTAAQHE
jgi:serine/threonine protein kinase